ncbi:MAG: HAD family hydrolase, partial [Phycisphaerales bacterium]|nr:HAD family hydrolase [Phycisphaerales bacterium]
INSHMLNRAIFLDRDNTIIENDGYLGDSEQVKLLPNTAEALAALRALGYRLIVVSNQSGVARGMFSEADVEATNQEMCRQLKDQTGVHIDALYYCPHHPDAKIAQYKKDHEWRKPKPGMLLQAARDFDLDLTQCWMIGDQPRDIAAGAAAGCRTILLRDPDHLSPDAEPFGLPVSSNYIIKSLADATKIIAREGATKSSSPPPSPASPPPSSFLPSLRSPSRANCRPLRRQPFRRRVLRRWRSRSTIWFCSFVIRAVRRRCREIFRRLGSRRSLCRRLQCLL